jgi:predicted nucleic acid-binding protein
LCVKRTSQEDARVVEGAWRIQDRYKLSWWDALIVSAAQVSDCRYLLTEDLQESLSMGNIEVINPFRTPLNPSETDKHPIRLSEMPLALR